MVQKAFLTTESDLNQYFSRFESIYGDHINLHGVNYDTLSKKNLYTCYINHVERDSVISLIQSELCALEKKSMESLYRVRRLEQWWLIPSEHLDFPKGKSRVEKLFNLKRQQFESYRIGCEADNLLKAYNRKC